MNKLTVINGRRLRSSAAVRCNLILRWKRRRAEQKLIVYIAAFRDLRDVVTGASERLLTPDLATELLVALVGVGDKGLLHKRLATPTLALSADNLNPEIPKAARWYLVGAQSLFGLELLLCVLDAGLRAVVLMVIAMVVKGILCKVRGPPAGVCEEILVGGCRAVDIDDLQDLPVLIQAEEVSHSALADDVLRGRVGRAGKLRGVPDKTEAGHLAVRGEHGLEGASERQVEIRLGARPGLGSRSALLALDVRLLHGWRELDELSFCAVLVLPAVHSALSLLSLSKGLCAQLHVHLPSGLPR